LPLIFPHILFAIALLSFSVLHGITTIAGYLSLASIIVIKAIFSFFLRSGISTMLLKQNDQSLHNLGNSPKLDSLFHL